MNDIVTEQQISNGAQSPNPSAVAFAHGASGEKYFTADDLARVRKEEKDKLYPEITTLREQFAKTNETLKALEEQRNAEIAEVARKAAEKEADLTAKREAEMSAKALLEAKLKETNETWEQRFTQFEQERQFEKAQLEKERAYNELQDYRVSRLTQETDDIAPQFHPFITGNTKDEIEAKITQAKQATQDILSQVTAAQQAQVAPPRGVSPTGYTVSGPMETGAQQKVYTAADINNMSLDEYAKLRPMLRIGRDDNRGLFG